MRRSKARRAILSCALTAALGLAGAAVAQPASPIRGAAQDYAPLLSAARPSTFVLLGESTHGTREFYLERARITAGLLEDPQVRGVAIEGDWSGAHRANLYVRGLGPDRTAEAALSDFRQFPTWMWRNGEFRDFVEALRRINLTRPPEARVGLYGLDVYDVFDAADAVVAGLAAVAPDAGAQAKAQYQCFGRYRRSMERYAVATREGRSCRRAAEAVLAQVQALPPPPHADAEARERRFGLLRAAATVVGGEEYFRVSQSTGYAWNARDRRMAEAATQISAHLARDGRPGRVAIWAHNTHIGDARETSQRDRGELSLGQLLRQRGGAFLVGFLADEGEVMAAEVWDGRPRVFPLGPVIPESHEARLRAEGPDAALRLLTPDPASRRRPQRAIGVVYNPRQERRAHYIDARLDHQFDAVVYLRRTSAVTPVSR
ncbi:erythromycin esterase family protein [Phenylobacterium sp.]|jgi:erythromycin esterase-like protein|uniref:erythromycin esterase family protein n=1 Tax=Phenylobacterium sp. TaxID=1871053 RepID=UPI002F947BDF